MKLLNLEKYGGPATTTINADHVSAVHLRCGHKLFLQTKGGDVCWEISGAMSGQLAYDLLLEDLESQWIAVA